MLGDAADPTADAADIGELVVLMIMNDDDRGVVFVVVIVKMIPVVKWSSPGRSIVVCFSLFYHIRSSLFRVP